MFIAEGEDLLDAALAAGIAPFEVLAVPMSRCPSIRCWSSRRCWPRSARSATPARVLSFFRTRDLPQEAVGDLALELHGVRDPGNIGTLLRSLAAFGPGTVVLGEECADPTSPKAVRASMGAIFSVPVVHDAPPGLRIGLTTERGAPLADIDLRGPVTFLVGAERTGIPDGVAYDVAGRIPQTTGVDSLNAAMAGTVALYEARRQRGAGS